MTKISQTFDFGDTKEMDIEKLVTMLQRMYLDLSTAINGKPDFIQRNAGGVPTDGDPSDTFLPQGTLNLNTATLKVEMLVRHDSPSVVTWKTL
jgi:hypothetical protein